MNDAERHHDAHHHHEHHHAGLARDLPRLAATLGRRPLLGLVAGTALAPFFGCVENAGAGGNRQEDAAGEGGSGSASDLTCSRIPEETAGPYPGDGSNGANALALTGILRDDIRSSIGGASGTAEGVLLTIKLMVVAAGDGCTPLAGLAVYLWHCDRDGNYSMYTVADQNYLRGVQETDENGVVTFTSVFPACYSGRMPHIHFEVYADIATALAGGQKLATSQVALPLAACNEVYASPGYSQSVSNLARISFATDNVFSDGVDSQLAEVTGSVSSGYTATLAAPVSVS